MKFNLNLENINYIKITYKDRNDFSHCIKASVKSISQRELYVCAKYEEELNIPTPQEVGLSLACEDGLYTSKTTLKSIEFKEEYIFLSLQTPENTDYKQDREYFRVKLEENAIISYLEGEKTKSLNTKTYDISANGVRLILEKPITFPEDVQIEFHFPNRIVHTLAKYVRSDVDDKILKASFSFVDLSVSDADYISQICIQQQLQQRKNKFL